MFNIYLTQTLTKVKVEKSYPKICIYEKKALILYHQNKTINKVMEKPIWQIAIEKIQKILTLNNYNLGDEYIVVSDPIGDTIEVCLEVSWGDWKHDHLFLDEIMKINGFESDGEEVTDEDGSDCYSANHYYVIDVESINNPPKKLFE